MKLALFDLDNTLIASDSDYLWGSFLCDNNYVDTDEYLQRHDDFYQDYVAGKLDIDEFLNFQLAPLAAQPIDTLLAWRERYIKERIEPVMLPAAKELVEQHRGQGHVLMIITATNRFLTEPIADLLGVEHLIACEPEMRDGKYTGRYTGIPSYQHGKVERLDEWLQQEKSAVDESWFYSDSHNDVPLLEQVDHPTAVDPDQALRQIAEDRNWPIISLR